MTERYKQFLRTTNSLASDMDNMIGCAWELDSLGFKKESEQLRNIIGSLEQFLNSAGEEERKKAHA